MKRRDFLCSAGAAATIPVLPLPAAAAPVAPAPVHAAKVGWAALYARTHAKASPALIQKWLSVGPEQAQSLMAELMRTNIVHAPVGGTAMAVEPMYASRSIPGARSAGLRATEKAKDLVRSMLEEDEHDEHPENHIETTTDEAANETS